MTNDEEFARRLCPHRGIGQDNTLEGIELGLKLKPFMLEFDIQLYDSKLHLGHPPQVNTTALLTDALSLYANGQTLPKVDMRLEGHEIETSLSLLATLLNERSNSKVLVNIAGELHNATLYMAAEQRFIQNTKDNILLNIDTARYVGKTDDEISRHVGSLVRTPFSLSPNLETDIPKAITFALEHHIPHIHFWSSFDRRYSREHLHKVMRSVLENGLEVYFDMKTENILS